MMMEIEEVEALVPNVDGISSMNVEGRNNTSGSVAKGRLLVQRSLLSVQRLMPLFGVLIGLLVALQVSLRKLNPDDNKTSRLGVLIARDFADTNHVLASYTSICPNETNPADLPTPVLLISRGRSGSSAIWQVITNMTGMEQKSDEHTGHNPEQNRAFFEQNTDETWLLRVMCEKRRQFPTSGVVGIQWKLFPDTLEYPGAVATLGYLAAQQNMTREGGVVVPQIKVIRSRRNVLDYYISSFKHQDLVDKKDKDKEKTTTKNKLLAHCKVGDTACATAYKNASTGLTLPTKDLVQDLHAVQTADDEIEEVLKLIGVDFLKVTYDELYADALSGDPETALAQWKRVFTYLGKRQPNAKNLTLQQVRSASATQITFNTWHNKTLSNYRAVRKALKGTDLEGLLHR